MNAVAVVVGLLVLVLVLIDSFETLLATTLRSSRWSIADRYYRILWGTYRPICARIGDEKRRERWLARLGPVSFVGLLAIWTFGEILGWGLVWWGVRHSFATPLHGLDDAIYYSGVVFFSIGFGDVVPGSGALRMLTVLEGFSGLGTLGLVIGYLPTLYSAYAARERQLLRLDDLTDTRITPVSLVRSYLPNGAADLLALDALFTEWADWCAETYDSHTSLPMLIWFRSKHRGQSWVTALGVVTDAAIAFAATVPGAERTSAMRLHRQSVRLITGLAQRIGLEPSEGEPMTNRSWSVGYTALQETGLPMRDFDESLARLRAMRDEFHPYMEAFIDELLAPRGFWGPTATDELQQADAAAVLEPHATTVIEPES